MFIGIQKCCRVHIRVVTVRGPPTNGRRARGKPLDGDNAHPFPDFYTYFRHYRAFYVAINSFFVALKFLKGILNTWLLGTAHRRDIDVPTNGTKRPVCYSLLHQQLDCVLFCFLFLFSLQSF